MRRLGIVLCLVLSARAGDEPVLRVFDVADLKAHDTWFVLATAKVKAAAKGATVAFEGNAIIVSGPATVQEKVAEELRAIRKALGILVTMEVRFVKAEAGLGVASVPSGKLDALLKERKAEGIAGPTLTCFNGQQASVSAVRPVSYVSDFALTSDDNGSVTADPAVEQLNTGITAKLRPFVSGAKVRVAAEVTVAEIAEEIPEVELPLPVPAPMKIQVPEVTTRSVAKLVDCAPGEYAVIDLGSGRFALILAVLAKEAEEILAEGADGRDIDLK